MSTAISGHWSPDRPNVLVVACSDGRLQEATDLFLANDLGIVRYDRFYVPGGAGALAASGPDVTRADRMRHECRYLIDLHGVGRVVLLMHGPTRAGSLDTACADYRRKLPQAGVDALRAQQILDARELLRERAAWAGGAEIAIYRCEIDVDRALTFIDLSDCS